MTGTKTASRLDLPRRGAILAAALVVIASREAHAQDPPTKATCGAAYVDGQRLLREGALKKARVELLVCAREPCPSAFVPECVQWLNEVDRRMPSVLFEAKTPDGSDVTDASVSMDGAPLSPRIDARAVEIDPGEHAFRFDRPGSAPVVKTIVLREGDKSRRVAVVFEPFTGTVGLRAGSGRGETPPTSAARPVGWPVWLTGGVGVAALASFAGFAIAGFAQHNTLNACKGGCSAADVSSDRTKLEIADVSLAVSVVALGTATVLFLTRPTVAAVPVTGAVKVDPFVGPGTLGADVSLRF